MIATVIVTLVGGRIGPAHADEVEDLDEDDEDSPDESPESPAPAPEAASTPAPKKPGPMKVPFVPFLVLAALEYLLGADALVQSYFRLMRGE